MAAARCGPDAVLCGDLYGGISQFQYADRLSDQSSVKILVMIKTIANRAYGPILLDIPIIWRAIKAAKPEFSIALLIAKAQAIVQFQYADRLSDQSDRARYR